MFNWNFCLCVGQLGIMLLQNSGALSGIIYICWNQRRPNLIQALLGTAGHISGLCKLEVGSFIVPDSSVALWYIIFGTAIKI